MSTIFKNPPFQSRLIQPKSFEDCLTYGEQIYCLYKMILELDEKIDAMEGKVNFVYSNGSGNDIGDDNPRPEDNSDPFESESETESESDSPSVPEEDENTPNFD